MRQRWNHIEPLITESDLVARTRELGAEISRDFTGETLHVIGVLKGCALFLSDLVRQMDIDITMDFLGLSSYGDSTKTSGVVRVTSDLSSPIEGRHVLIVEDIVDSGLTVKYLMENLQTRHPESISVCTLLHKKVNQHVEVPLQYVGFEVPDAFVVGYGLDYAQLYRNVPYIGVVHDPSKLPDISETQKRALDRREDIENKESRRE